MEQHKAKVITSLFWKFFERMGTQGIQFIIQLILARLLLPEDYGVIALITVFISLANVFVQSGFNTALIQQKDVEEEDYSSVFVVSAVVALIIYILLFVSSDAIAAFYKMPNLSSVIKILGLVLFFGAFNSIQIAKVSREFQFKKLFYSSLGANIFSGILGIILAYYKFGVWALVAQQLSNQFFICVILLFIVDWKPHMRCNLSRIKNMFDYGWKLLVSNLIDVLYNNIYSLVIGKFYKSDQLGYYNRADQFPNILVTNVNGSIQSVMLPALSEEQDNLAKVKSMVRRSMVTSSFFVFPAMAGLAACSEPLIELLLTEKWLFCVPIMRMLCLSYAFWPIHTANLQAINAIGRSDVFLKLEIIKKMVGIICLIISLPFGVIVMAFSKVVSSVASTVINAWPNRKLLNYSFLEQIYDIAPSFLISLVMGGVVYLLNEVLMFHIVVNLAIEVIVGGCLYLGLAKIFKLECLEYILNILKKRKN